jgi:hypothetical protein
MRSRVPRGSAGADREEIDAHHRGSIAAWNDSRLPVVGAGPNAEQRDPGNDTSRRSSGCGADRRQDDSGEDQLAARMPGRRDPLRLCRYRHQRLLHEGPALRLRARRPLSLRTATSRLRRPCGPHLSRLSWGDRINSPGTRFARRAGAHPARHGEDVIAIDVSMRVAMRSPEAPRGDPQMAFGVLFSALRCRAQPAQFACHLIRQRWLPNSVLLWRFRR